MVALFSLSFVLFTYVLPAAMCLMICGTKESLDSIASHQDLQAHQHDQLCISSLAAICFSHSHDIKSLHHILKENLSRSHRCN